MESSHANVPAGVTCQVKVSHTSHRLDIAFDDPNLVSHGGLELRSQLARPRPPGALSSAATWTPSARPWPLEWA